MNKSDFLSENNKKVLLNRGFTNNTINSISRPSILNNNKHKKFINEILYIDIIIQFNYRDISPIKYKYYNFENLLNDIKKIIGEDRILTFILLIKDDNSLPIYNKNQKIKQNINKITSESVINVSYVPKLDPSQLADFILKGTDGPERINKLKPAATLNNGGTKETFNYNWISYKDEERDIVKHILSDSLKLDIDIYFSDPHSLFYSKEHITLLAEIYEYTLIDALNHLSIFNHTYKNKEKDFIYICFGDLYGLGGLRSENQVNLTKNGQLKFNKYLEKIKEIEKIRIFNKKVNIKNMKNSTYNRK
jgi:hypothetical protein